MKNKNHVGEFFALVLLVGLIALGVSPSLRDASAQSPVTLKVYDPTGAFEVTQIFSPRLADLNGKTICELSNNSWEHNRILPEIRQLLQKQFPTSKIISYDKLPSGMTTVSTAGIDSDNAAAAVKAAGCEAVIVGMAG
jgi:hypothetical protein